MRNLLIKAVHVAQMDSINFQRVWDLSELVYIQIILHNHPRSSSISFLQPFTVMVHS